MEGDVMFDIGSNIGIYSLLASNKVKKRGKVYSFEPNPIVNIELIKNIERNNCENVVVFDKAVYEKSDVQLKLFVHHNNYSMFNSLIRPIDIQHNVIDVNTVALDDFIENNNVNQNNIKLVKIDVEGAELDVLKGAKNMISQNTTAFFLVEFCSNHTHNDVKYLRALYDFMTSLGYQWYLFDSNKLKFRNYPFEEITESINLIAINSSVEKKYSNMF